MFAQIENDKIIKYPIFEKELREEICSNVVLPKNLDECEYLINLNILKVINKDKPSIDEKTQYIEEGLPEIIKTFCIQNWVIKDYSKERIQEIQFEYNKEIKQTIDSMVYRYTNTIIENLGYKNAETLCSFYNSFNIKFKNESKSFLKWRDEVWEKALSIQEDILNEKYNLLEYNSFISELPEFILYDQF
jgi:hypothetical protein